MNDPNEIQRINEEDILLEKLLMEYMEDHPGTGAHPQGPRDDENISWMEIEKNDPFYKSDQGSEDKCHIRYEVEHIDNSIMNSQLEIIHEGSENVPGQDSEPSDYAGTEYFQNDSEGSTLDQPTAATTNFSVVKIKHSSTKKRVGHFKCLDNVIVCKYFNSDPSKSNRIVFESNLDLEHGDVLKVFLEAQNFDATKDTLKPRDLLSEQNLKEMAKCDCYEAHNLFPFCVKSENATVGWCEKSGVALLKPIRRGKLQLGIGFFNTDFGKAFAKLVFQLQRNGEIMIHNYFVKANSSPSRELDKFVAKINQFFGDRDKLIDNSACEPPMKKLRHSADINKSQALEVHCPSENEKELLMLLRETNAKYYHPND